MTNKPITFFYVCKLMLYMILIPIIGILCMASLYHMFYETPEFKSLYGVNSIIRDSVYFILANIPVVLFFYILLRGIYSMVNEEIDEFWLNVKQKLKAKQ